MLLPYAEYLRSPEWAVRRAEILSRDTYCCQDCGSRVKLHVHHLTYSNVGSEPHWHLITVCADCHARRHETTFQRARNGATWDTRGSDTKWRRRNWPELQRRRVKRRIRKKQSLSTREESFYAEAIHGPFGGELRQSAEWLTRLLDRGA